MRGGKDLRTRKRSSAPIIAFAVAVVGLIGLLGMALLEARSDPVMRVATVTMPAPDLVGPPFRVALLSDIHIGNRNMQPSRLNLIVDAVNAEQPDLIVIVGDFVNGSEGRAASDPAELTQPLSRLRAKFGVVATLGNHDHWTDPARVAEALSEAGIDVLSNQASRRGAMLVVGIDDAYSGFADIEASVQSARNLGGGPMIAVSHSPDLARQLPRSIPLLLAGHTHCGQMRLPFVGGLAPIFGAIVGDAHYYDARYECGLVQDDGRTIIVTAGLGSGAIPLRLGAPPDWWIVNIESE